MEGVDSILKGSGEYNIRDNTMSALAAFTTYGVGNHERIWV